MTRRFVRDVALLVAVELVDLAEILGRGGVAEAALFAALRLRGRARRILIGIERESPHQLSLPCDRTSKHGSRICCGHEGEDRHRRLEHSAHAWGAACPGEGTHLQRYARVLN